MYLVMVKPSHVSIRFLSVRRPSVTATFITDKFGVSANQSQEYPVEIPVPCLFPCYSVFFFNKNTVIIRPNTLQTSVWITGVRHGRWCKRKCVMDNL